MKGQNSTNKPSVVADCDHQLATSALPRRVHRGGSHIDPLMCSLGAQAAFKAPSLGTGTPKTPKTPQTRQTPKRQSLDWDKVKAEDKTLVHQVGSGAAISATADSSCT